jgi:hypothetical protein
MSIHNWLIKIWFYFKLQCGNKTLIKINYNYIFKLKFGHWKCHAAMEDIVVNDIYDYAIFLQLMVNTTGPYGLVVM